MKFRKWLIGSGACLLIFACALIVVGTHLEAWRRPTREPWSTIDVGERIDTVRRRLGPPVHEYTRESAPEDYYVEGWRRRERPITGSVHIWMGADLILYVWCDADGKVEETFTGSS